MRGHVRSELSPRLNLKFTYQLSPNDTIIGFTQYDQYNQKGRLGFIPGWAVTSQDQTVYEPAPSWTWNAQYRKVFGSSTFLEVKFLGWWGYYDTLAETTDSPHINVNEDGSTSYSGGAGYVGLYDRTRNQVTVAVTKYASLAGTHTFKFGLEIERSTVRDRFCVRGQRRVLLRLRRRAVPRVRVHVRLEGQQQAGVVLRAGPVEGRTVHGQPRRAAREHPRRGAGGATRTSTRPSRSGRASGSRWMSPARAARS